METNRLAAASCALGMIVYCAVVSLLPASEAAAGADPTEAVELRGVVRDFHKDHVDFDIVDGDGFGHNVGNVAESLGEAWRPVFVGGGARVDQEFRNRLNQPIAPQLFLPALVDVIPLGSSPLIEDGAAFDTWDSTEGEYGGGNIGPAPTFDVGAAMPVVIAPAGLGPSVGDLLDWAPGVITLDEDIHCDRFTIPSNRTVEVEGDVTILCDAEFHVDNYAQILLGENATLRVYLRAGGEIDEHVRVGVETSVPGRVQIFNLGVDELFFDDEALVYAHVVSPDAQMRIKEEAHFFGTFVGQTLHLEEDARFHLDVAAPADACGTPLGDTAGILGVPSQGGIDSADSFAEWFKDIPGTNLSMLHTLTLLADGAGGYYYESDSFHPIDDRLFGNEGAAHNAFFTYAVEARFIYDKCGGQQFNFEGDDDVWIFIDGRLVADLGGITPGTEQFVDLDRLGLADGRVYRFQLYYAQRQSTSAALNIKTTIAFLDADQVTTLTAPFD